MIDTINQMLGEKLSTAMESEIFVGIVAASLFGSAIYFMKSVPAKLLTSYIRLATVEVKLYSYQPTYEWMMEWISKNSFIKKSRRLQIETSNVDGRWIYHMGEGYALFWYCGRPVFLHKEMVESKSFRPREVLSIRTPGRSRKIINKMAKEAEKMRRSRDEVRVYMWKGDFWSTSSVLFPRYRDTLFLNQKTEQKLFSDVDWFLSNQKWYQDRGVPYRRGYLLYGPPGTGKSSIVKVLASEFGVNVYTLDLNSVRDTASLMEAFSSVPRHSILLIEDIDTFGVTRTRENGGGKMESEFSEITLSSLLNAMDGIASSEAYMLIMTSNNPEQLDPALVRSGRVDVNLYIGYPEHQQRMRMHQRFLPNKTQEESHRFAASNQGKSASDLQCLLVEKALNGEREEAGLGIENKKELTHE